MIDLLVFQLLVLVTIGLVAVFIWHHLYRCQEFLEYIGEELRHGREQREKVKQRSRQMTRSSPKSHASPPQDADSLLPFF